MAARWQVYLAGEIHSNWRASLISEAKKKNLPVDFSHPELDHGRSDGCGDQLLGAESSGYWRNQKAARMNSIRIRTAIERADVVVVCFGEKYRQWNAAFEAGLATAMGKRLIVIHPPEFDHALKEVDAFADVVARDSSTVLGVLDYAFGGMSDS